MAARSLIGGTARLLALGAVRILERGIDSNGREIVDGEVLNKAAKFRSAELAVTIDEGAVLDVSGAQALFGLPTEQNGLGSSRPVPRLRPTAAASPSPVSDWTSTAERCSRMQAAAGAKGGAFSLAWGGGCGQAATGRRHDCRRRDHTARGVRRRGLSRDGQAIESHHQPLRHGSEHGGLGSAPQCAAGVPDRIHREQPR